MIKILTAITSFVILFSCTTEKIDRTAEGEKLMQVSREWSKTASAGNTEQTLSYWDDSAVVMLPGQPAIKGKEAIRQMIEGTSQIPGFTISWEPKSVEVAESGDMAWLLEETQTTMNDSLGSPVTQKFKAVTVWKKNKNGDWKNVVDIYN